MRRWPTARGNVWVGRRRDLFTLAHASAISVATVERMHDGNLLLDETLAAATDPAFYIGAIAVAPRGAWPMRCEDPEDTAHLRDYLALAATEDGIRALSRPPCPRPPRRLSRTSGPRRC